MKVGEAGSLVEGADDGLGIFGSLEGALAFGEDEDDFRVMLILEDCAFFDGSLVEVGEGGLGSSLEATYAFGEDEDGFGMVLGCALKEALSFEDCAFFDLDGSGGRSP